MGNYEYEPIKKLKENNKKKMFFMFLSIFMFLGISLATIYFVYRFNDERENTITSGLVDIDFKEQGASINLQNTVPMTDEAGKKNDPYIFTVENISKIPINLKIGIEIGESTIDLSAIRYALYINNEEIKVDNLENLDSENNLYIKEQFASGAKVEVKLVFWIDYYYEKSGGSFSGKIKVEGEQYDIIYEETGAETIKKTIGQPGGVIGIVETNSNLQTTSNIMGVADTSGDVIAVTEERSDIREYRYSGPSVNNYVYFNCETDATEGDASSKCELWRIIGVFKDENGEHLKIVRNEILSGIFPETFEANDTTYNIKYDDTNAYLNRGGTEKNDWATAGLQYWLNAGSEKETKEPSDGYMSYLSKNAKDMIKDTKYYLGTITYISGIGTADTPKEAYVNERDVEGCIENTGNDKSETGCKVWSGNKATWEGKIALMYLSDYGFSVSSDNWGKQFKDFSSIKSSSWLNSVIHNDYEWLLSPSSNRPVDPSYWYNDGSVGGYNSVGGNGGGVRPTVNLKSSAKIVDGNGTFETPYFLSEN